MSKKRLLIVGTEKKTGKGKYLWARVRNPKTRKRRRGLGLHPLGTQKKRGNKKKPVRESNQLRREGKAPAGKGKEDQETMFQEEEGANKSLVGRGKIKRHRYKAKLKIDKELRRENYPKFTKTGKERSAMSYV